jgi:glycosyltransferase involved in cell wall biosynthesis
VYDNASGDQTAAVVAELAARDPRVRYHCHASNIGAFNNFQFALSHVDTPYFSILSDDDVLLPGFLQQAMECFAAHPEAMFWAGLTLRMSVDGVVYDAHNESWPREGLFTPPDGLLQLATNRAPTWTAMLFRREVTAQVGLLDPDINAPSDLDFLLRIAARASYFISRYPAAIFLLNPQSFSEVGPFSALWPGWLKMIDNVVAAESLDLRTKALVSDQLNAYARRFLFRRAANALAKRDYGFARQSAQVLRDHYGQTTQPWLLDSLAALCASLPPVQGLCTRTYQMMVNEALRGRADLQLRYGDMARFLKLPDD